MWWGYSEALDLVNEISDFGSEFGNEKDEGVVKNILLIGQFDNRHVLKTIAQKYRHNQDIKLNFYIYEPLLENIARELLFTVLALEPVNRVGMAEKTIMFMELYGNSLLRPSTKRYLIKVSKLLLNLVTNLEYCSQILPSLSLDNLKYKEKDQLEMIFKYWCNNHNSFDIDKIWNDRLRKDLGVRYDSRIGVFDWDYHMRYHCSGAEVLKLHEYKRFRERGISFYFEDTDPCLPNSTLASGIFYNGSTILSYGYLGDITTGPYPCFGFKCEDEDMFKKKNGQLPKSATDVTERNLMRIFYEIQNQSPFVALVESDEHCLPVVYKDTSSQLKTTYLESTNLSQIKIKDDDEFYESINMHNCKIIFLPITALKDYCNKISYHNLFDLIYVCQSMALKHLNSDLLKMFKPNSKMIFETPKFLLNYRKENLKEFKDKLIEFMNGWHCKLIDSYNFETDEFVRFEVLK